MNRVFMFGIILFLSCISLTFGQDIYLAPSHEVYSFLKRMEARQLITDYKDAAKPLSRSTLAGYLKALELRENEMTRIERETFEFLKIEFKYEMLQLSGDPEPTEVRWHVYSHELTDGILNIDLNYSISKIFLENKATSYRSQGIKVSGYVYSTVGYYFNIVDNSEKGDNVNYSRLRERDINNLGFLSNADREYYTRIKTNLRGVVPSQINSANQFQYDEIDAQVNWKIGSFSFSLEKMNNVWGYGRNGTVIFSDHAPSYPQIKIRVPFSKDIDFIYFHGELNSDIVDSSRSYTINYPSLSKFREVDHQKYIAAHQLEISLWNGVDLSLGESVVYSDRGPLLIYLIPVMFFKAGEHYNGDKDNCQLFGSLDLNVIKNVNAYFSLFIDEINTDELFDPNLSRRQVAFTTGVKLFDLPAANFDVTLEYTRVNPAAYNHNIPSVTFTNNGFTLGSWMGQNADNVFVEVGITPLRALHISTFGEIFRKGGTLSIVDQYAADGGNRAFLFGPLHIERSVGFTAQYEPVRDVFLNFRGRIQKIEDEANPSQNRAKQFEFYFGARVGLW
jgi:hypothetical protein